MELREKIANEVQDFTQRRIGWQSCLNAADAILALPELKAALALYRSQNPRDGETMEMGGVKYRYDDTKQSWLVA